MTDVVVPLNFLELAQQRDWRGCIHVSRQLFASSSGGWASTKVLLVGRVAQELARHISCERLARLAEEFAPAHWTLYLPM